MTSAQVAEAEAVLTKLLPVPTRIRMSKAVKQALLECGGMANFGDDGVARGHKWHEVMTSGIRC